jgi:uncharacterized protein
MRLATISIAIISSLLLLASARGDESQAKPKEYKPLDLANAATIVSTKGMFFTEQSQVERLVFADWKPKTFQGVPFRLVDPQGDKVRNVVMLNGPQGVVPPRMPHRVSVACKSTIRSLHILGGISGWGAKGLRKNNPPVTMIVRFHYADGVSEDHSLYDGQHFADYIGRFDVPKSKFAFAVRGQQVRYLSIAPKRSTVVVDKIEFLKGQDRSAPIIVAATVEK